MNEPERHGDAVSAILRLQFLDFRIDVETNSLRLAAKLQSYFAGYLAPSSGMPAAAHLRATVGTPEFDAAHMQPWRKQSAPDRPAKESYYDSAGTRYILKNRTGVLIRLSDDEASCTGKLEQHSNQVVNLVGTLFGLALVERGYVMLHGSAVVRTGSDEAVIFLGNSGSGKSSLALQMIERGSYEYVSNDRVLLKMGEQGEVEIVGLPKKPRVNPGTLLASSSLSKMVPERQRRAYEQLDKQALWELEEKTDVDVERSFGVRTRLAARLARIYCLEWRPTDAGLEQGELDPRGALDAMRKTAKDFGCFDLRPRDRPSAEWTRIAESVPFTVVRGKADPSRLAAMLVGSKAEAS